MIETCVLAVLYLEHSKLGLLIRSSTPLLINNGLFLLRLLHF